ncbi:MFS transporter [Roseobacter denitrificans]|uniref:PucC protein n=1 Tax=Roseobacter denitrificans (strain ATCC 33942 / OCh 114) TaxID=375451 RepID=Q162R7_ROSDO|nr:PucC family protein [Roseobacter denitrificans]ABG33026.1 PucC protein [Roseobacter denitrificans OCh 114]AVL52403.1 MFS transporter [Roseobacter denitrificans]SFG09292.1 MFS transporter, BCD family, chlorophyll transporter [Roseobacter denitrificans OCh 114]
MFEYRAFALRKLVSIAPRYLPFADVATKEVPLSRLLRLSLFQVTVGMAIVLLVGTLNRVMIVELSVPATLVAMMLALPLLFAPFRTLIGYKSDVNVSALGLRRVPFIWKGTLYQFGGFAIMPFALLVLSGYGEAVDAPRWMGLSAAALAFLLVGAGVHMVQTVGLALATDLVADEDQPKVVGLMYVMLLVGMVLSALVFGTLLENYTPGRLIQVIQGAAVMTVALNLFALWKQEARDRVRAQKMQTAQHAPFRETLAELVQKPGRKRLLVVIALGTFGFGAADVLLEPYGAQALGFSVAETTRLTALLAGGTLIGFGIASRVLSENGAATRLGLIGALIGIPGFSGIILSAFGGGAPLFLAGTLATGIGAGLFGHATLTATMRSAEREQIGLALGTWGAVQATAAGVGVALAGIVRDIIVNMSTYADLPAHAPYNAVFLIEIVFLALACATLIPLCGKARTAQHPGIHPSKRSIPDPHPKSAEAS